ncbi:UxaA family hydrolase [Tabrizicola sp.]|uniref:UxaA family hydrolase n=1 Tax=Tabrizicola sp. TaxID=2005166 RepID=UPI00260585C9|nr:UxaA family hydrolase [Tabrizicola sp.]MDM7931319.1 UxaA family hydrolase [Tabrizicola sp.]
MTGPFLLLHPDDNVLVARATASAGTKVTLDGGPVVLTQTIPMAHKIARSAIALGETLRKYGMPIGIAPADIAPGAHVHVHNIRSGYTPGVVLQDADGRSG